MKITSFYGYLALLVSVLILAVFVLAIPGIPHQFKGTVTINGSPADDAIVKAVVEGDTYTIVSVNGEFGIDPAPPFFVSDPDGGRTGEEIKFFVDDVDTGTTAIFQKGGFTTLDLAITQDEPPQHPGDTGGSPGGGSGGGGGGGSGSAETSLLKVDKTIAEIGEDVTASVKCLLNNGCVLKIDGVEVITFQKNYFNWHEYTTSFDTPGDKVFSLYKARTAATLIGSKTVTVIDPNAQEEGTGGENQEENIEKPPVLCTEGLCDDQNPCTIDTCLEGLCIYDSIEDGTPCSQGQCLSGICVSSVTGEPPEGQGNLPPATGFFGLGEGLPAALLLLFGVLVGLTAMFVGWQRYRQYRK